MNRGFFFFFSYHTALHVCYWHDPGINWQFNVESFSGMRFIARLNGNQHTSVILNSLNHFYFTFKAWQDGRFRFHRI